MCVYIIITTQVSVHTYLSFLAAYLCPHGTFNCLHTFTLSHPGLAWQLLNGVSVYTTYCTSTPTHPEKNWSDSQWHSNYNVCTSYDQESRFGYVHTCAQTPGKLLAWYTTCVSYLKPHCSVKSESIYTLGRGKKKIWVISDEEIMR